MLNLRELKNGSRLRGTVDTIAYTEASHRDVVWLPSCKWSVLLCHRSINPTAPVARLLRSVNSALQRTVSRLLLVQCREQPFLSPRAPVPVLRRAIFQPLGQNALGQALPQFVNLALQVMRPRFPVFAGDAAVCVIETVDCALPLPK